MRCRKIKAIATVQALCVVSLLAVSTAHAATSCATSDAALLGASSPVAIGLIEDRLRAGDISCAAEMMHSRARALAAVTGPAGIDARFALRELALAVVEDRSLPSAERLRIAAQAAGTIDGPANAPKEDVQADVRLLASVARRFATERDSAAWLDALELAIRLDRRLGETDRRLSSSPILGDLFSEAGRKKEFARLARLARVTQGDKALAQMRSGLAAAVFFDCSPWRENASREEILKNCADFLELVQRLDDVTNCAGYGKEWRWRPIFRLGLAYHRLNMADKAKIFVDQGLSIVHGIDKPDHRLGEMRSVLSDLIVFRYDRRMVLTIANEMKSLSASSSAPMAMEVRKTLPETMKRAGFKEFR